MRKSRLSGIYFNSAPTLLNKQLKEVFESDLGPGVVPGKEGNSGVKGIITPFHEYGKSGPCSAWAYKALAESKKPDIVIIAGQSEEDFGLTTEPYETPLGFARVDHNIARKLADKKSMKVNNPLFDNDDFIESQLPFLQYIYGTDKSITILPLLLNAQVPLKELAVDLKEILMEEDKTAVIVIPTNFTKHGRNYQYLPFSVDVNKKVYELDRGAIDLINDVDPQGYLEYVHHNGMNTENFLGITFSLLFLKPKQVLLEQYYTTADLDKDFKNFVSFASLVLK